MMPITIAMDKQERKKTGDPWTGAQRKSDY